MIQSPRKKYSIIYLLCVTTLILGFTRIQTFDLENSMRRGKSIYYTQCVTCHQDKGEGIPTVYPPLAKSDFLFKESEKSISFVLNGASESITVNGIEYTGEMTNFDLTDEQVSDVLNFIRNSWGNSGEPITLETVRNSRKKSETIKNKK